MKVYLTKKKRESKRNFFKGKIRWWNIFVNLRKDWT